MLDFLKTMWASFWKRNIVLASNQYILIYNRKLTIEVEITFTIFQQIALHTDTSANWYYVIGF